MLASLVAAALLTQTPLNTLTDAEKEAGWKLLFDGKSTAGWHNYKEKGVKPGWKIENGTLVCSNPYDAGDIVTDEQFDWFELSLEFNLGKGENSGVVFHATEEGERMWQSGPEVQLHDHAPEKDVEITGYLYMLYAPPAGVDSAKPAGEWNHLRLLVSKEICQTDVNGVKYYDFVLGSEDFWKRVAASKFSKYPFFAKAGKGSIGLQGDHGNVSFRNVKIRPITP